MKPINFKRTIIIAIVLSITFITPIFAVFETWVGTSFISHNDHLDNSEKINFKTMCEDSSELESVTYLGPSLEVIIYPDYVIPVGLKLSSDILFPIGYNSGDGFRSFNFDLKNRNKVGLSYNQTYNSNWGMSLEFGYEYDFYRNAKTNIKNSKIEPDYYMFSNHNLYGEIGLLTTIDKGYFKLCVYYSHSIINDANTKGMILSGGIRF